WFAPVSPGTEEVTLGGMVAADVHGKNHHVAGTFGGHVEELLLRVADGRLLRCSPQAEPELFWATVGGMGLTGHILEVAFRLDRATVGLFNRVFVARQRATEHVVHPAPFFYPLDRVQRWSRLYGRRGMTQHQCVLPGAGAAEVERFLRAVRAAGGAPFLAVL